MKIIILLLSFAIVFTLVRKVCAIHVDMKKIMMIESSGNPAAFNIHSRARGLFQITPICLKEWNNFHPDEQYEISRLWNVEVNTRIAKWYMNERIPQLLNHYKLKDTIDNRLSAFNMGIGNLMNGKRFKETDNYIAKYRGMK